MQPTNMISSEMWQQELNKKLSPAQQNALQRIVLAGMKVMFSKETHQMMLDQLSAQGTMPDKLAQGIARLMVLLLKQSNKTMPPDMIIPSAWVLMAKACEYLQQSGTAVSEDDFRTALPQMIKLILKVAGATDEQIAKVQQGTSAQVAKVETANGLLGKGK